MKIRFKVGKNVKTGIRRVKDNSLINEELKRKQRSEELDRLLDKAAKASRAKKEAEERRRLKDQIKQAQEAERKAKYAGWYRAGKNAKKGMKATGKFVGKGMQGAAKRADKISRSKDFETMFGMGGVSSPKRRSTKKSKKSKRKPRKVVYY